MPLCYTTAMNDDQLDDLKQFIDSRISQTEATFETMLEDRISQTEKKLERQIEDLRNEMHDGFAGIGEAIEELHNADDELDKRLTKLEHQAAA